MVLLKIYTRTTYSLKDTFVFSANAVPNNLEQTEDRHIDRYYIITSNKCTQ